MSVMAEKIAELYDDAQARWPEGRGMTKADFEGLKRRLLDITADDPNANSTVLESLWTMFGRPEWDDGADDT